MPSLHFQLITRKHFRLNCRLVSAVVLKCKLSYQPKETYVLPRHTVTLQSVTKAVLRIFRPSVWSLISGVLYFKKD